MIIQLTLPALERLIGGDTEIELALRKQIVQEFATRHLKAVVNEEVVKAATAEARAHVNDMVKEHFGVTSIVEATLWPMVDYRMKSRIEDRVKQHAQKAVDEALAGIIESQKRWMVSDLREAVRKEMDRQIEKEIQDGIRSRLSAAIEQKPA
jgi:FKBP-type peptidyl-prolyl cis-trans isomerase (trigger factor)